MADMLARVSVAIGKSIALSIVLKATLVVGLTIVAVVLTRAARASVRHLLLASTFGILALLPVEEALLPPLSVEIPRSDASRSTSLLPLTDGRSVEHVTAGIDPSRPSENRWAAVSAATLFRLAWAIGVMASLGPVVRGLWRRRRLRHDSASWSDREVFIRELSRETGIRGTVAILLHEHVRAPATFGFIRPAIVLPIDAQEWSGTDLLHAMVRELEHVFRADWIVHLFARVVYALYWFHPFAWVTWRQLCLEAEHACDDAVLRGAERTQYAQQLVELARRLSADPVRPVLSMATRADLSARVLAVLDAGRPRGRVGALRAAVIVTTAVVVVTAIAPLRAVAGVVHQSAASTAPGQSQAGHEKPLAFEVASIKSNKSGDWRKGMGPAPGGRFTATNVTFRELVPFAYGLSQATANIRVIGGPKWMDTDHFDVVARAQGMPSLQELSVMVRTMLAERFRLSAHTETKELPVYALVMAKRDGSFGPQLRRSEVSEAACAARRAAIQRNEPVPPLQPGAPAVCGTGRSRPGSVTAVGFSLGWLADTLGPFVGRVVLDRTGLTGLVNLGLEWTPDPMPQPRPDDPDPLRIDPHGPSVYSALADQLGLKLESTKGPVSVLVIDRLEHPTED